MTGLSIFFGQPFHTYGIELEIDMDNNGIISRFKNDIEDCDMLLIGLGSEWKSADTGDYAALDKLLAKHNYFVVTSCDDGAIMNSTINTKRITAPFFEQDDGEAQWNLYNKWLQSTLNKKLVIVELGEGFASPNFMRWPFENITFINNKAFFYRVNEKLPNVPENITDKSCPIKENSVEFVRNLL